MNYTRENYMAKKYLKTVSDSDFQPKVFKDRHCELEFIPSGKVEEGLHLIAFAFK